MFKPLRNSTTTKVVLIFVMSYVAALLFWLPLKSSYGALVTAVGTKIAGAMHSAVIEEIRHDDKLLTAVFAPRRGGGGMAVEIPVSPSAFSFNFPLTVAIMAAMFPFLDRKRRAYAEVLTMLFCVHVLFVFALCSVQLGNTFMDAGILSRSTPRLFLFQFLWSFTDNMVIRFEPFLLGLYLYFRFRSTREAEKAENIRV